MPSVVNALFAQHTYVRLTEWADECLVRCVMPTVSIFCAFCGFRMVSMQQATVSRFDWRGKNRIKGRLKPPSAAFTFVCIFHAYLSHEFAYAPAIAICMCHK